MSLYNVDIRNKEKETKKRKMKMTNMIVLNTRNDLIDLLDNNDFDTLVGRVAFALDLLDDVRANDNMIEIAENLGFHDDGGWIEIDEMGYVVADEYLP